MRIAVLLSIAVILSSADAVRSQSRAQAGFDKLKSLAGKWLGKDPEGQSMNVSYQVVSGGSVVIETLGGEKEPAMITVYHLDGDKIMVTHYCSIGNQPRMRAEVPQGDIRSLSFKFVDVTNLANHSTSHMQSLTLTFPDKDHLTQVWTYSENGKDMQTTFNLERKKQL
jgi:hypothetical protein